jgi:hypothetical protein
MGSLDADELFDPTKLSGVVVQVKYKTKADPTVEDNTRPLGIVRNLSTPLPYVAFVMELGSDSSHQDTKTRIKSKTWPESVIPFGDLVRDWRAAVAELEQYKEQVKPHKTEITRLSKLMKQKEWLKDSYNRFAISVRGVSDYGVLVRAHLVDAFKDLLKVTLPSPVIHARGVQLMRPLEQLGEVSGHRDFMVEFSADLD